MTAAQLEKAIATLLAGQARLEKNVEAITKTLAEMRGEQVAPRRLRILT